MADRLSQLQTCLDQLVTQYFSSINYISKHHDFVPVSGEAKLSDPNLESSAPEKFKADLTELARDIARKAQQCEILIDSLPGLETSEKDQVQALQDLEKELQSVRQEQQQVHDERKRLLTLCDDLIMRVTNEKVSLEKEA